MPNGASERRGAQTLLIGVMHSTGFAKIANGAAPLTDGEKRGNRVYEGRVGVAGSSFASASVAVSCANSIMFALFQS
jgi:hypothetical protein